MSIKVFAYCLLFSQTMSPVIKVLTIELLHEAIFKHNILPQAVSVKRLSYCWAKMTNPLGG